jgi:hypothetical protein
MRGSWTRASPGGKTSRPMVFGGFAAQVQARHVRFALGRGAVAAVLALELGPLRRAEQAAAAGNWLQAILGQE